MYECGLTTEASDIAFDGVVTPASLGRLTLEDLYDKTETNPHEVLNVWQILSL